MNPLRNRNGGALIEFVLIAPVLLLILFGIIEFGLILYNQAVITNASREGARFGIVARNAPRYTPAEITVEVNNYCADQLITFGATSNPVVSVTYPDGGTAFGDDLQVQVSWNYTFLVLPNLSTLTNLLTLNATTVMKYE